MQGVNDAAKGPPKQDGNGGGEGGGEEGEGMVEGVGGGVGDESADGGKGIGFFRGTEAEAGDAKPPSGGEEAEEEGEEFE